jgi:RES domain-containing protein
VAAAPLGAATGAAFRHVSPSFDPLSAEGARIGGGRFNPAGSFPVLYLCRTRACAVAELRRLGERQRVGLEGLLPRYLYRFEVALERVLDLSDASTRLHAGIGLDSVTGPDWTACQELGVVALALGIQAIECPSATGVDEVLAVFVQNLGAGRLEPQVAEEWRSVADLDVPPSLL